MCGGLVKKASQLEVLNSELGVDVWCLTEHQLQSFSGEIIKADMTVIDNFYCSAIFCRKIYKGGGSAIFVKNSMESIEVNISDVVEEGLFEATAILLKHATILCVYKPPYSCNDLFLSKLQECVDKLISKRKYLFICGDINIDTLITNQSKRKGRDQLEDFFAAEWALNNNN